VTIGVAAGAASARNLRTCSSVWACPVCSHSVWGARQRELEHLLRSAEQSGLTVALITLTARHQRRDDLSFLLDGLRDGWKGVQDSRKVRTVSAEMRVAGFVRRTEATWGNRFGWHPHLHLLVFAEPDDPTTDFHRLADDMFGAWRTTLVAAGLDAPLRRSGGVDVKVLDISQAEEAAAGYLTQDGAYAPGCGQERRAARELSDRGGKRAKANNSTTWELLEQARGGDKRARALWGEWERTTKGRKPWAVSKALRQMADDCTAVEDEPVTFAPVGAVTERGWQAVCREPDGPSEFLGMIEDAYRSGLGLSQWLHDADDGAHDPHLDALGWAVTAFQQACDLYGIGQEIRQVRWVSPMC
jgi:hypothetical protein